MTPSRKQPLNRAEHDAQALEDARAQSTEVARRLDRLVKRCDDRFLEAPEVEALVLQVHRGATNALRAVEARKAFAAKMTALVASLRFEKLEELEQVGAVNVALEAFPREGSA